MKYLLIMAFGLFLSNSALAFEDTVFKLTECLLKNQDNNLLKGMLKTSFNRVDDEERIYKMRRVCAGAYPSYSEDEVEANCKALKIITKCID